MNDPRYQFQPWYVKTYRWLRYRPAYVLYGIGMVLKWFFTGAELDDFDRLFDRTRWGYAKHLMAISRSMAAYRMKHTWTIEELRQQIHDLQASASTSSLE